MGWDKVEVVIIAEIIKYSWYNIYTLLLSNPKLAAYGVEAGSCCVEEQTKIEARERKEKGKCSASPALVSGQ